MYYNTTNLTNPTLSEYKRINSGQDATILDFFKANRGKKYTPFAVAELANLHRNVPITSVRRSLNSLTNAGYLVKTDEVRESPYGRPNHVWTLKIETK